MSRHNGQVFDGKFVLCEFGNWKKKGKRVNSNGPT